MCQAWNVAMVSHFGGQRILCKIGMRVSGRSVELCFKVRSRSRAPKF